MKSYTKLFFSILILFLVTLAGCTKNPKVTELTMDEAFDGEKYGNILVIGAAEKITFRTLFEGEIVSQFKNQGVEAVPSIVILPDNAMLERETILSAIKKSDIDSVLVTSLASRSKKTVYYAVEGNNPYVYYNGILMAQRGSGKTSSYDVEILFLKTNLYDVRTEKLIWSMTSESEFRSNPESLKSAAKFIINKLLEDGLI